MQVDVVTMSYRSSETSHVENPPPSIIIVVDLVVVVVVDVLQIHSSHVAAAAAGLACHINSVGSCRAVLVIRRPVIGARHSHRNVVFFFSHRPTDRQTDRLTRLYKHISGLLVDCFINYVSSLSSCLSPACPEILFSRSQRTLFTPTPATSGLSRGRIPLPPSKSYYASAIARSASA